MAATARGIFKSSALFFISSAVRWGFTPGRARVESRQLFMNARFALGLMALLLAESGLGLAANADEWPAIAEMSARQLQENPKNEEAWATLARAQMAQDDLQRAEKTLADWKAKVVSPAEAWDRIEGELALKK